MKIWYDEFNFSQAGCGGEDSYQPQNTLRLKSLLQITK